MEKQRVFYKWFVDDPLQDEMFKYLLIDKGTRPFVCINSMMKILIECLL